ncbi:MAG TPA: hypothetical protein ENH10_09375, partial [Bacteroidetes bacterium]|nr:hypothetical protein [Bacteroidota bacterium]HEX05344.1 hypothetical protein [Bacteroidota bacterium]
MRTMFIGFVILMLSASFSFALEKEEFERQWNAAESKDAKLALATEVIASATDLDEIRSIQDMWEDYNRDSALEFFTARADENRTAENLYLLGRLQDDPSESISLATKSIEADPSFTYAYRLLVVTYMNNLFDAEEDGEHYATLKASFDRDFPLMEQIRDYLPDDGGAWGLLYEALVYRKDYANQLKCLDRGKGLEQRWASVQGYTNAYVGLGDYAVARAKLEEMLDERIADDRLEPEMREEVRLYRYFTALEYVGAWDEAIRYFKSYDGEELATSAKIYLATAYLNSGKKNKAIKALEDAAELGFDTASELTDYGDFDDLMDHRKWDDLIASVKQNRIDSAPERRAELLAKRMDLAAP